MNARRLATACATVGCMGIFSVAMSPGTAVGDPTSICPDGYMLVPIQALPPDQQARDKNNNGLACAKGPQGSNEHFNAKDDKGVQVVDDIIL